MSIGVNRSTRPLAVSPATFATPQSPSVWYASDAWRRCVLFLVVANPKLKRPSSNSHSPSTRACLISLIWVCALTRSTWEPMLPSTKPGLVTPFWRETALAMLGYQVGALIGRPLLNQYSCAHAPPQCGALPGAQLLVPAMLA